MKRRWKLVLLFTVLAILVELVSAPIEWLWPKDWGGSTYWRGKTNLPEIALTFDDGPSKYTSKILDILKEENIPATFFVMGRQAELYPGIIKRMVAENHEIGNHTYSFGAQWFKFFSTIRETQVGKTQRVIADLAKKPPRYFRSPGGQMGRCLWNYVRKHNLQVVNGSLPIPQPRESAEEQLKLIRSTLRPGAIIILHDGDDGNPESDRPKSTVELLPMLLEELDKRGYQVVPLNQLLNIRF